MTKIRYNPADTRVTKPVWRQDMGVQMNSPRLIIVGRRGR